MGRTSWAKACSNLEATQWSRMMRAGQAPAREDLAALCQAYWPPVYRFVRASGFGPPEAEGLTEGFFSWLASPGALDRFEPQRGRFRAWLRTALSSFLDDELERRRARKRAGPGLVTLEDAAAEEEAHARQAPGETADRVFDRRWALAVTARALARVRADLAQTGEGPRFGQLADHLVPGSEDPAPGAELGPGTGAPAPPPRLLKGLRRRYSAYLREEVAATVARPDDVDGEIMNLLDALS